MSTLARTLPTPPHHTCPHAPRQVRGNALLVCDRAVCRVLMGYFDSGSRHELDDLPHLQVDPGVIELRRSCVPPRASGHGHGHGHTPPRVQSPHL